MGCAQGLQLLHPCLLKPCWPLFVMPQDLGCQSVKFPTPMWSSTCALTPCPNIFWNLSWDKLRWFACCRCGCPTFVIERIPKHHHSSPSWAQSFPLPCSKNVTIKGQIMAAANKWKAHVRTWTKILHKSHNAITFSATFWDPQGNIRLPQGVGSRWILLVFLLLLTCCQSQPTSSHQASQRSIV